MTAINLIRVYACTKGYDSGFEERVYTQPAFDAFLADLEQFIASGKIKLPVEYGKRGTITVDRPNSCIFFEHGGETIELRWELLQVRDTHTKIEEVAYRVGGVADTYLHVEEE